MEEGIENMHTNECVTIKSYSQNSLWAGFGLQAMVPQCLLLNIHQKEPSKGFSLSDIRKFMYYESVILCSTNHHLLADFSWTVYLISELFDMLLYVENTALYRWWLFLVVNIFYKI